jgi:hypothetical protein
MSEFNTPSSEPEELAPNAGSAERYPTEEELRNFEARREYQRLMGLSIIPYTIEKYARNPEHPTEDEIKAVDDLNRAYGPVLTSFEEYFGYPDPRQKPSGPQDDQRPPESKSE